MSAAGPGQTARDIIEASLYLVLATADAAGRPWSSPVYFAHIGFTEFFWVSSPDVTHSRNIEVRPEVGIVVFDSGSPIRTGQGVYMSAAARDGQPDHRIPCRSADVALPEPGRFPERYATANSTDPSRSMLATTTSRGRTGTASVSPPDSTTWPASRPSPAAASDRTSQATAAAG
jgi:hypothetical protein